MAVLLDIEELATGKLNLRTPIRSNDKLAEANFDLTGNIRQAQQSDTTQYVGDLVGTDKTEWTAFGTPMVQPIGIKNLNDDGDYWVFPIEPLISVEGNNVLTRRRVAKRNISGLPIRGTIKERWMEDDFTINISGVFINPYEMDISFTTADIQTLYRYCTSGQALAVWCPGLLDTFGITTMVIESFDFPHTKGIENQSYSIKAYSDDQWQFLWKLKSGVNSVSGTN